MVREKEEGRYEGEECGRVVGQKEHSYKETQHSVCIKPSIAIQLVSQNSSERTNSLNLLK